MDEQAWLKSTDPQAMLNFLRENGEGDARKLRLFAIACVRAGVWDLLIENGKKSLGVAEQYADGLCSRGRRRTTREEVMRESREADAARRWAEAAALDAARYALNRVEAWPGESLPACEWILNSVDHAIRRAKGTPLSGADRTDAESRSEVSVEEMQLHQSHLLRDIFGPHPFRPVTLPPSVRTWNDGIIVKLAAAIYEERLLPEGTLDQTRLAVLADALEEAGVTDPDILGHLREQGAIHLRGCWCLDLLLEVGRGPSP